MEIPTSSPWHLAEHYAGNLRVLEREWKKVNWGYSHWWHIREVNSSSSLRETWFALSITRYWNSPGTSVSFRMLVMVKLFKLVDENMVTWMAQLVNSRSSNTGQQMERFWTKQSSTER
jgi:hypothetical protein